MANLKLRGERDSADAKGPASGPMQSPDIGAMSIPNTPAMGAATPTRSSGARTLPNSSLGATRIKRYTSPCKA